MSSFNLNELMAYLHRNLPETIGVEPVMSYSTAVALRVYGGGVHMGTISWRPHRYKPYTLKARRIKTRPSRFDSTRFGWGERYYRHPGALCKAIKETCYPLLSEEAELDVLRAEQTELLAQENKAARAFRDAHTRFCNRIYAVCKEGLLDLHGTPVKEIFEEAVQAEDQLNAAQIKYQQLRAKINELSARISRNQKAA